MNHPPFFIVGCARSGTTMLRRVLNHHSLVCVPEETKFVPSVHKPFVRFVDQGDYQAAMRMINEQPLVQNWKTHVFPRDIKPYKGEVAYAQAINLLMTRKAERHGKKCWGEKTPSYIQEIPLLKRLFPEARFIHLYRDGRDVALSVMPLNWGPNNTYTSGRWWRRAIETWEAAKPRIGDRALEIGYETFVNEPERELQRLCDFLDLPYEDKMLEDARIRKDRCMRWKNKFYMSIRELKLFEYTAGGTLEQLGYEKKFEDPSVSLTLRIFALVDDLYKQLSNTILRK